MTVSPSDLASAVPAGQLVEIVNASNEVDAIDPAVLDLTHDSRQVRPGWAFACVVGERLDGHDFAPAAVEAGATLLLVQRRLPVVVPQIVVRDVRRALGPVAAAVHDHPASKMRLVGVTGTNGKTTTAHLLGAILASAGIEQRQVGTLSGARTTPEATDVQRQLAGFVEEGADAVVMEVSSHALALHRVAGIRFGLAVFTNLGRDHLDLHGSLEAYFRAKASLFSPDLSRAGVTNLDDPYGRLILDSAEIDMVGFSAADAHSIDVGVGHLEFVWRGHRVRVPIGGRFNVMNVLAALSAAVTMGISVSDAVAGLSTCPPVPGRFELVTDPDRHEFAVVVDYAHTPDGIAELLSAARALTREGKVIIVFGCGGDRDVDKRPLMGAAAARGADVVVLTSDNPRSEDPRDIIDGAASGIETGYRDALVIEVDRRAAISAAIGAARSGDVVVIAGKGHETTQTIGETAHPFDDRIVAREVLGAVTSIDTTGDDS